MTSHASARKLTYDDLLSWPDDGLRHELIDGEQRVSPSPALLHQRVSRRLLVAFAKYLEVRPIGEVFAAPVDVVLSLFDVCVPDLVVVLDDQKRILTPAAVKGAPALVIEIASPGSHRFDSGRKRRLYESRGVREYWLVSPEARTIERHSLAGGAFASELFDADAVLTSPLLPGFSLTLTSLWADARI